MLTCELCDEPIMPGEAVAPECKTAHRECAFRMVSGSVGHMTGVCPCHGFEDTSENGMTRRQAARAALEFFTLTRKAGES